MKYLFVTGGVISGLGKGISTASIAQILKSYGYKVSIIKVDMYLNIDAGTINPLEHGEVFVTHDGLETDQDLGNYERFADQNMQRHNYMTMGQIYYDVITRERRLEYGGEDVEGHVHVPKEIIRRIKEAGEKDNADIVIIEVGGTVGEYQNVMFFEAIRRLRQAEKNKVFLVHLVYLLKPKFLGELKSKPAQSSIYELYKLGLQPDFVIARSNLPIDKKKRELIAFNSGIPVQNIIAAPDVKTIYEIPELFIKQKLGKKILKQMGLKPRKEFIDKWGALLKSTRISDKKVKIAILGKYFTIGDASILEDAYICVIEAIKHAGWKLGVLPEIQWFNVERLENKKDEKTVYKELAEFDGIILPQGWGSRGVEGKIKAARFARENNIPYLGLCFGMQMATIEFARDVLKLKDANSEEVNPKTPHPVIHIIPEQKKYLEEKQYGGTIRLGAWPAVLEKDTKLMNLYRKYGDGMKSAWYSPHPTVEHGVQPKKGEIVFERHRHRYEFNMKYRKQFENAGFVISALSPDGKLVEAIELKDHPFFVATQYHPEYESRPLAPHPVFMGFIEACKKQ